MFVAVRRRRRSRAPPRRSCSNACGARSAYAPFAQSTTMRSPVRSEPKRSRMCCEVASRSRPRRARSSPGRCPARARAAPRSAPPSASESLWPVRVEELDAVVLGRVVRRGDDDAEVEREQRDGGRRQHAAEDAVAAGRDDAACERLLELDARMRACRGRRTPSPRLSRATPRAPSRSTSSGVRNSPTTPRTPSVPKYLPRHERGVSAC